MKLNKYSSIHTGGRKTASAVVKLKLGLNNNIFINGKQVELYFHKNELLMHHINKVTQLLDSSVKYNAFITVNGGGLSGQAQAISLALSKAFLKINPNLKNYLKEHRFLTRDARIKERRKYGLKKARKASQFSKR